MMPDIVQIIGASIVFILLITAAGLSLFWNYTAESENEIIASDISVIITILVAANIISNAIF